MTRDPIAAHWAEFDDEILFLSLQLEEISVREGSSKGKYRADDPPDNELAISVFQADVLEKIGSWSDRKLAYSIARALETDERVITAINDSESQAQQDRRLALQLNGDDPGPEAPPAYTEQDFHVSPEEEVFRRAFTTCDESNAADHDDEEECIAGPSMTYAERQRQKALERFNMEDECCTCVERFRGGEIIRLECGDVYCTGCLKDLFMRASKDQTLYPPRCCRRHIPLSVIVGEMSAEERETFESAVVEFSTEDRTYCSSPECGKFIPPTRIEADRAICGRCGSETCALCKRKFHIDDCPADPALQATLELSTRQGWQRCYRCRALLELTVGCNHMTCHCGAQFCYVCGEQWKHCHCARWQEERLVNRAEEIVDREAERDLGGREREHRVQQMQDELRENHECEHPGRFQMIRGGRKSRFECEMCGGRHRNFILQCRRCHLEVCQDCRMHRV
ncbi:hypothetical protein AJ80_02364 [Polytolypa hystricis UAMH7299]|uniref:RBR-type E3 ubiquitin transferase n=1 Tax=Polytolypa hystricis (strain UAMH7299) TaxID=1447883 RepID=A0A2B7YHL8_POLH7|nr:hypothetical protein AJ80_02364 [Polytolypa hystricis UAMH7299]